MQKNIILMSAGKKGADLEKEELMNAEGVLDFQEYIKKRIKSRQRCGQTGRRIMGKKSGYHSGKSGSRIRRCPPWMLLTGNTGRQWEESVRISHQKAKKVIRVVCGIGTVIKNA